MQKIKFPLSVILLILFLFACATVAKKPDWVLHPPKEDRRNLIFMGIASGAGSLDSGQDAAIKNAMSQISDFLGTKIQSTSEQHITEMEQHLKMQITTQSKAKIQNAQVADWYYVQRDSKFDVFVLVKFPKVQVQKELNRQLQEKSDKANTAYDLYTQGKEVQALNQFKEAGEFYRQSREILNQLDEIVALDRDGIKNTRQLLAFLETGIQKVSAASRGISLDLAIRGPTTAQQVFASNFSSSLGEKGFTITQENPAIHVTGSITTVESGFVLNNHIFYAEGSVSALRKSDKQVIGTVPIKTKGFGADKTKAALSALANAGSEAGENLADIILDHEAK